MGVSLYANSKYVPQTFDMGYGGFFALRSQIANAFDEEFGKHYSQLPKASCTLLGDTEAFNQKTNQILADKKFEGKDDILDFFFASDCEGSISYNTCKKIYDIIKDVDFQTGFQYGNFSNGTEEDWKDLKEFFLGCHKAKVSARWYKYVPLF